MLIALAFLLVLPSPAQAAEEILSYASRIEIAPDGQITVVETIRVNAEGNQIRRGIYRDFPLRFADEAGRLRTVGFKVLEVSRNGSSEDYRIEQGSGFARVYMGSADRLLSPGTHDYVLRYQTDRQIRYFDAHDEFYWNVTGNGWIFPIREVSAEVLLPSGADVAGINYFTGVIGSTERAATAGVAPDQSRAVFRTTRVLAPGEGLTVAVRLDKGVVAQPDGGLRARWFLRDNAGTIIALAGLALVMAYYVIAWLRIGRDPRAGVIVPRWDIPADISPALASYIERRGFGGQGWEAMTAAILSLAVKGHVVLTDLDGDMTVEATPADTSRASLPVGEAAIIKALDKQGGRLTFNRAEGDAVQGMADAFRAAMAGEHRNRYYRHNRLAVVGGVILSVAALVALLAFGSLSDDSVAAIVVPALLAAFLVPALAGLVRRVTRARSLFARIVAVVIVIFFAVIGLTIATAFLSLALVVPVELPATIATLGIVATNLVFLFLMGAPTAIGRRMMDTLAGLKQYLRVAEAERMNLAGAPDMSPAHYERMLPYAVALGVEKPWSAAFRTWLSTAAAAGVAGAYAAPSWYHGSNFRPGQMGGSVASVADSLATSLAASAPVAQSSASGFSSGSGGFSGGGFSGGGGGGGGGGGW